MKKGEMAWTNSMHGDEQKSIPISFLYYLMRTTNHKPPHHYFIHISTNNGKDVPVHASRRHIRSGDAAPSILKLYIRWT
jgi:hypothetical protein